MVAVSLKKKNNKKNNNNKKNKNNEVSQTGQESTNRLKVEGVQVGDRVGVGTHNEVDK